MVMALKKRVAGAGGGAFLRGVPVPPSSQHRSRRRSGEARPTTHDPSAALLCLGTSSGVQIPRPVQAPSGNYFLKMYKIDS